MNKNTYDSSCSGYVMEIFEGIDTTFTDVEILYTSEVNVVAKAKRYGRWWLLKGLRQNEAAYQQRLRKEFEILIQLQHPNIVSAIGIEPVGNLGECIVMEFVDGVTLKEWLQGTPKSQERRRVARELTEAVGYVHAKGIVHRDLKPENILITTNGKCVKLVDFGLADTDSHAILKQPAGTLRYMSPEQLQTAVADVRNDIYSLGIIFDEMNLGYGHIVKKCLLPLEKRYKNVAELLNAKQAREKRRTLLMTTGIAFCILLLVGLVGTQTMRLHGFASQTTKIHKEQARLESTITMLNDSINQMAITNRQLADEQERQNMKRQRVETAIEKGKARIDKAVRRTGLEQHFDTLSSLAYLDRKLSLRMMQEMNKTYESYVEQIKAGGYTETDIDEIANSLAFYQTKWNERYHQLCNKIGTKDERKTMQGN
ncbi:MAG: serine/threonine protein kinase [Prevotella sp.]|nr:serine/threonine protein kinase [Prevotella sp.]